MGVWKHEPPKPLPVGSGTSVTGTSTAPKGRSWPQRLARLLRWVLLAMALLFVEWFMLSTAWDVGFMTGYNESSFRTHQAVRNELSQNCQHWFTDKKRQHKQGALILCKTPDWMEDAK